VCELYSGHNGVWCNRVEGLEVQFDGGDVAYYAYVKNEGQFSQGINGSMSGGVGNKLRGGINPIK